jgi:hypothetical protein
MLCDCVEGRLVERCSNVRRERDSTSTCVGRTRHLDDECAVEIDERGCDGVASLVEGARQRVDSTCGHATPRRATRWVKVEHPHAGEDLASGRLTEHGATADEGRHLASEIQQ